VSQLLIKNNEQSANIRNFFITYSFKKLCKGKSFRGNCKQSFPKKDREIPKTKEALPLDESAS
jgi:hypothetical protein